MQVTNDTMGGDPAQNQSKALRVDYTLDGRANQVVINEGDMLRLNRGGVRSYDSSSLQIDRAVYGAGNRWADVTNRLNSQVRGDQLEMQVSNDNMGGDPAQNQDKTLRVDYTLDGRSNQVVIREGDTPRLNRGGTSQTSQSIRCESDDDRKYCPVDTRGGVRLSRQLSSAACTPGSTWGYDNGGVWVSNGCRADFDVASSGYGSASSQTLRCESENSVRKYCAADTRG